MLLDGANFDPDDEVDDSLGCDATAGGPAPPRLPPPAKALATVVLPPPPTNLPATATEPATTTVRRVCVVETADASTAALATLAVLAPPFLALVDLNVRPSQPVAAPDPAAPVAALRVWRTLDAPGQDLRAAGTGAVAVLTREALTLYTCVDLTPWRTLALPVGANLWSRASVSLLIPNPARSTGCAPNWRA